jgi:EmrB/QacA subfamily drug resistance transporter
VSSPAAPRPGLVLAVLALGFSAFSLLQSLVVPALSMLQREFQTGPTGATWIFTVFLLSASIATPIAGRLGDMFGKKRSLVVVLAGFAAGTLLAALTSTLWVLIVARAIQGVGGAMFPLAFSIIRDEFPRERVAGAIALLSGLTAIGGGLGIVLTGPILARLDYHWLFWIPLVLIVASLLATVFFIPESPVRAPGSVNWVGAILLALCLVCLLLPISEAARWGWLSARVLGLLAASAVLGVAWVRNERRAASPLVDMRMMRLRGVWTTNLAAFLFGLGLFGATVLIPQFVQTGSSHGYGFGSSVTESGLFLLPSVVSSMIASVLGGRLAGRFGSRMPLVLGSAITVLGFVGLAVAHTAPWQIYLAAFLFGAGVGFGFAALPNLIVEAVPPDQTGVATGMNSVFRTIGGTIGSQVVASILAATLLADGVPAESGYTISYVVLAAVGVVGVIASLLVPGKPTARTDPVAIAGPHPSLD